MRSVDFWTKGFDSVEILRLKSFRLVHGGAEFLVEEKKTARPFLDVTLVHLQQQIFGSQP